MGGEARSVSGKADKTSITSGQEEGGKEKYKFSEPMSASWDEARVIPADGWERMKMGVQPQQMEDRWIVAHLVEKNGEGIVFARSWTGHPIAKMAVVPAPNDDCARRIVKITWEGDEERWRSDDGEAAAKRLVARFSRGAFQVDLVDGEIPDY